MTGMTTESARESARPSALLRDVVLVTAAGREPLHGYELAHALGDWRPASVGQLYRLLGRLATSGLMASEWDYSTGGAARHVYALTPAGEVAAGKCRAAFSRLVFSLDRYTSCYEDFCRFRHRPSVFAAQVDQGLETGPTAHRRVPGAKPTAAERRDPGSTTAASARVVRQYLEALEVKRHPAPSKELKANLKLVDALLVGADPETRLELVQRRQDLLAAVAERGGDSLAQAEDAFTAVARAYSEDESITHAAWADAGVEARVLEAAGIAPASHLKSRAPTRRDIPCPRPLLRCWLLLLVGEAPRHGYELGEALVAIDVSEVDRTRLYRVLHGLADDAFVASQWRPSGRPAPERRVYSLTPAGEKALDASALWVSDLRHGLRGLLGVGSPPPAEPSSPREGHPAAEGRT